MSELVSVQPRYARSVHLERDYRASTDSGYILTECALESLRAVATAIRRPIDRAMTIVGPYGAGKSAFCVFVARLFESQRSLPALAELILPDEDAAVLRDSRLLVVPVVGSRQPLGSALVKGLLEALRLNGLAALSGEIGRTANDLLQSGCQNPREVADLFERVAKVLPAYDRDGLLLIVDELGKFLEYAALHPGDGDVFVLQELAEAAPRTGETPLLILGILHQNAEAYSQKLSRVHQAEWAKVAERYRSLAFFPSDLEQVDLIGKALGQAANLPLDGHVDAICNGYLEHDHLSGGLRSRFLELAQAAYPLHPLTLLALPTLFRRTGQSHRSLFNFIAAEEPHALGTFLKEVSFRAEAPPFYTLDRLFDYATEILAAGWHGSPFTRAWADAVDALERAGDIGALARRVLKVVALLGILRDPRLPATQELLELCFVGSDLSPEDVRGALSSLKGRKLIVIPRGRMAYRLCETGDVDVEAALAQARSKLPENTTLDVATRLCPPPRLIARRHSYETGAVRTVAVRPCTLSQLGGILEKASRELTLVLCLARDESEAAEAERLVVQSASPHVLSAVAIETDALREAALDVAAAAVAADADGMDTDRAARRELASRQDEAVRAFQAEWTRLFGPEPGGARWWRFNQPVEMSGARAFSELLSRLADQLYSLSPRLRNELINRHQLSSSAAAGRRSLIEAMLSKPDQPRLGMDGYPPELSMYECLLRATGLHREVEPERWVFAAPDETNPARLSPSWRAIERFFFDGPPQERSVQELFQLLRGQPYGLTDGVLPVLLCAFLQAQGSETSLYREGTFLPEPSVADWEVLLRRPDLFAVAGCRILGERRVVVERLARGFGVEPELLPIVRYLLKMVRTLPEHAWKTQRLPAEVLAIREACKKVRSPERLLFSELPLALGVTLMDSEEVDQRNVDEFFRKLNEALRAWAQITGQVIEQAREQLLAACGITGSLVGWSQLQEYCAGLVGTILPPTLAPFVQRVAEPRDLQSSVETVLALVADRPPRTWSDVDVERFDSKASAIGGVFRQMVNVDNFGSTPLTPTELQESIQLASTIRSSLPSELDRRLLRAALASLLAQCEIEG